MRPYLNVILSLLAVAAPVAAIWGMIGWAAATWTACGSPLAC